MIYAIVQARMGSTRLPGKVMMDLGGRPVLSWVVEALNAAEQLHGRVIVATTTLPEDHDIEAWCRRAEVTCFRGPVNDVLRRFLGALDGLESDPDGVMRITADCPLHDPQLINATAGLFAAGEFDYVSTVLPRSLPRGLDIEIIRTAVLRELDTVATGADRVHVTSYLHRHAHPFSIAGLAVFPSATDLRLTLDTAADAELLRLVVAEFQGRRPSWLELVSLLRQRPDLVRINADVDQKRIEDG